MDKSSHKNKLTKGEWQCNIRENRLKQTHFANYKGHVIIIYKILKHLS